MVGWLVQDQQVRTLDEETCQCEPRTFPTRERGDRTMDLISPKQETRQVGSRSVFAHRLRGNQDRERRSVDWQPLVALGVVANLDVRAKVDTTRKGSKFADNGAQECRFAAAILTDDGDAIATLDSQFRSVQQHPLATGAGVAHPERRASDDLAAAANRRLHSQGKSGMLLRPVEALKAIESRLAPSCLSGSLSRVEASDEFFGAADELLLFLILLELTCPALRAENQIAPVWSGIVLQPAK